MRRTKELHVYIWQLVRVVVVVVDVFSVSLSLFLAIPLSHFLARLLGKGTHRYGREMSRCQEERRTLSVSPYDVSAPGVPFLEPPCYLPLPGAS